MTDQPTHHGYAVNVKDYACLPDALRGDLSETTIEAIYESCRERFWADAQFIATEHGFRDVYSEGRMGGWCVPMPQPSEDSVGPRLEYVGTDGGLEAWLRDRFRPFERDILAAMEEARADFLEGLEEARAELEERRDAAIVRGDS